MKCIICQEEKEPSLINDKYCNYCAEKALNAMVERLRNNNPNWDYEVEFGSMLKRNINDFTPAEFCRYNELKQILGIK